MFSRLWKIRVARPVPNQKVYTHIEYIIDTITFVINKDTLPGHVQPSLEDDSCSIGTKLEGMYIQSNSC